MCNTIDKISFKKKIWKVHWNTSSPQIWNINCEKYLCTFINEIYCSSNKSQWLTITVFISHQVHMQENWKLITVYGQTWIQNSIRMPMEQIYFIYGVICPYLLVLDVGILLTAMRFYRVTVCQFTGKDMRCITRKR